MGLIAILRGNNDAQKRAFVNNWLETLEFQVPEPPPPLISEEPQPTPVWTLRPPTPLPAMRRFDNIAFTQWQDPYATAFRIPAMVNPPYTAGLPYDPSRGYKRVLVPYQEQSSDEDEGEDDGTFAQAGMILSRIRQTTH
jgi:hypothetical protein